MKILFVGGSFDDGGGHKSSLVDKFIDCLSSQLCDADTIRAINGGWAKDLPGILNSVTDYGVVFWWANVPNDYPKMRNVKEINRETILVSSKRNDDNKYSFQELINRALSLKANLTVEFSKNENQRFDMRVFDPLGVVWASGDDVNEVARGLLERLSVLLKMERQGTTHAEGDFEVPDEPGFFKYVKECAEVFHKNINPAPGVTRFLGNSSFRCQRGFPSFRSDSGLIFVSKRNIDKRYIDRGGFVPVTMRDNFIYYWGREKPSVDTPVQVRLYELFPNINYMIHSHCYVESDLCTKTPVPCGALNEVDEILEIINDRNGNYYAVNLVGHGCIIMGATVNDLNRATFKKRNVPETFKGVKRSR